MRILDHKGIPFQSEASSPSKHGLSSAWSDTHLKRSELYNLQLREVFQENLSIHRWMNWITGGSLIDLSTSFTKLTRERADDHRILQ